jgi:hypothetical protein
MKRMNQDSIKFALCALFLTYSAGFASAQTATHSEYPKVEVFAGFSALGEANGRGISFGPNGAVNGNYNAGAGFETSVIGNLTKHVGLKGDFSAHFGNKRGNGNITRCIPACTTATQDFKFNTRVYDFLAGPEFKARNSTRFTPFGHVLAGVAHTSANFTTPGPTFNVFLKSSNNGFAMGLGGGLDIRATKRVSFRGQLDYNPVFINDSGSGTRDFVRLSLGVLFH